MQNKALLAHNAVIKFLKFRIRSRQFVWRPSEWGACYYIGERMEKLAHLCKRELSAHLTHLLCSNTRERHTSLRRVRVEYGVMWWNVCTYSSGAALLHPSRRLTGELGFLSKANQKHRTILNVHEHSPIMYISLSIQSEISTGTFQLCTFNLTLWMIWNYAQDPIERIDVLWNFHVEYSSV